MSVQTINLSAADVQDHLAIKLPAGWTSEASELEVVCYNHRNWEIGFIVTLEINAGAYSFTVHEITTEMAEGNDHEETNKVATYDEALSVIRDRMDTFLNPDCYF